MLPLLAGDIPWAAGGLMRCFEIVTDEDTLTNASFPARRGQGTLRPRVGLGQTWSPRSSPGCSTPNPTTARTCSRSATDTTDLCVVSGVDVRGGGHKGFVSPVFDVMAGGYGAQVHHDGVDTGGRLIIPSAKAPDVEMTEYLYPLLALWRREETDSGGPGRRRGGMSGSVCYVQHPDQSGDMSLVVSGTGKVANQNVGLAGGHPGNSQLDLVVRGIDVPQLAGARVDAGRPGRPGAAPSRSCRARASPPSARATRCTCTGRRAAATATRCCAPPRTSARTCSRCGCPRTPPETCTASCCARTARSMRPPPRRPVPCCGTAVPPTPD
ncbi:hydantoinase B/oxoprolinase family protein [Streptomyces sp. PG2]